MQEKKRTRASSAERVLIGAKLVWARDLWHLRNRLVRMMLLHTIAVLFNIQDEHEPLQLAHLVA